MAHEPTARRRTLLVAGAGAALSACATAARPLVSTTGPAPSSVAADSRSTVVAALPAYVAWQAHAGEVAVAAKTAAVRHIERLGNAASRRLTVIDAQYGGLLSDSASVLVVCESWHLADGVLIADGHTFDVRLSRTGAAWTVTAVYPSAPGEPSGSPSTAARAVLASSRISLPPAARADVASGQVHDSALEAMLTLSQRWAIAISVIRSGHPLYVFGTSRLSDHPRGRAFDTWAIDDVPVVAAGRPNALVPAYMEALAGLGSYNVGGPVLLGAAPQFFSDQTHHDHVHAGFPT